MSQIIHDFRITQDSDNLPGPHTGGIDVRTNEEVRTLSELSGLPLWPQTPDHLRLVVRIDSEDSRLARLYDAIWQRYGLKPSPWHVVPQEQRHLYFGVRRKISWSKKEIDACELLWLRNTRLIANQPTRTREQIDSEAYVANVDGRLRSGVQFGSLMPFTALAVAEPLRSQMEEAALVGLWMPAVQFVPESRKVPKPLWALRSSIVLPRAVNLLQGEDGHAVEPNTEWWCWWDDGGRDPAVLRFRRVEIAAVSSFDIAMTFEKVGHTEEGAYRQCIVSQRFREVMTKLKVKGVDYVPVELV